MDFDQEQPVVKVSEGRKLDGNIIYLFANNLYIDYGVGWI